MSKKGKKSFSGPQPKQPDRTPTSSVNLGFYHASTVLVRDFKSVQVVLAGCGGIGAYMAQHIARIMRVLYENNAAVQFTLFDPDIVEEKNLGRQLFCDAEIGRPKAVALATRYGQALGLNTMAFHGEYHEGLLGGADLTVLVGCVDNAAARRTLSETLRHNPPEPGPKDMPRIWWLDCGNNRDAGRVLLGSAYTTEQMRGAFYLHKKKCISLPSPALQSPGLLTPQREELEGGKEMSCAELAAANLQSLNINAGIAVQAADMLTRLLVTHDLKRYACAVGLAAGSLQSDHVTPQQVARDIGRSEAFVIAVPPAVPAPHVQAERMLEAAGVGA
jgi:PRTRC genetic system ThiF family protein